MRKEARASTALSAELLQCLDFLVETEGYGDRSEAVRTAVEELVARQLPKSEIGDPRALQLAHRYHRHYDALRSFLAERRSGSPLVPMLREAMRLGRRVFVPPGDAFDRTESEWTP